MNAITLDLSSVSKLSDEQYYELAIAHQSSRMERTPDGEIVICLTRLVNIVAITDEPESSGGLVMLCHRANKLFSCLF